MPKNKNTSVVSAGVQGHLIKDARRLWSTASVLFLPVLPRPSASYRSLAAFEDSGEF